MNLGLKTARWIGLVFALLSGGRDLYCAAAPVTFRFDAVVGKVFPGTPFDSGVEFEVGDLISGQFTFQPALGDGSTMLRVAQPYHFTLHIDGAEFLSPTFDIEVFNNTGITDFPPANQIDSMNVGGGGLAPIEGGLYPNIAPSQSGFRMRLFAPIDALDQAGIPPSDVTWNAFGLERTIHISFGGVTGGAIGFQANITSFVAIPEPSALQLTLPLLMTFIHRVSSNYNS